MIFDVVTLTLKFDLPYKTIDGDYDFWIRGYILLLFTYGCRRRAMLSFWQLWFLTWWPWPWSLTFWKTLTLRIAYLPEVIGLSYYTCVFLVTRPFIWYRNFWPLDLDLEVRPTSEKLEPLLLFSDGCRPASVVVFWQLLFISVISFRLADHWVGTLSLCLWEIL